MILPGKPVHHCRLNSIYLFILLVALISDSAEAEIEIGKPAPAFEIYDQNMQLHSLDNYSGKWLVIFFYTRDNTPGCTLEVRSFNRDITQFRELDAEVLGISLDSVESHAEFSNNEKLTFPLLADPTGTVAGSYASLLSAGKVKFARRNTMIINRKGILEKIYHRVDPRTHSQQVIDDLRELQANEK